MYAVFSYCVCTSDLSFGSVPDEDLWSFVSGMKCWYRGGYQLHWCALHCVEVSVGVEHVWDMRWLSSPHSKTMFQFANVCAESILCFLLCSVWTIKFLLGATSWLVGYLNAVEKSFWRCWQIAGLNVEIAYWSVIQILCTLLKLETKMWGLLQS